jgi:uncharacterized protein YndB with AHSA1/START domain
MPVLTSHADADTLTFTVVVDLAAPPERVWRIWEDPRQLERWWGPPGWPATFERHELARGGESRYVMTGPDGTRAGGWWSVVDTDAPHSLVLRDGFCSPDGEPADPEDVTTMTVTLEAGGSGTRMTILSQFRSPEQFARMSEMGMREGMTQALGQVDELLTADDPDRAPTPRQEQS